MPPGHHDSFDTAAGVHPTFDAVGSDAPLLEMCANLERILSTDGDASRASNPASQPAATRVSTTGERDGSESSLDDLERQRDGLTLSIGSGTAGSNSACSSDSEQNSARSAPTRRRSILKESSIGSNGKKRVGRSRSIQWSKNLSETNEGRSSRYDQQPSDEPAAPAFGATRPSLMSGWRHKVLAHGSPGDGGVRGALGRSVSTGGDPLSDDDLIKSVAFPTPSASFPCDHRVMFTPGGRKPSAFDTGHEAAAMAPRGADDAASSAASRQGAAASAARTEGSPSPSPGADQSHLRPPQRLHLLQRAPVDLPGAPDGAAAPGSPPPHGLKPPSRLQMLLQTRPNGDHALSLPRSEAPAGADEASASGSASFQPSLRARRAAQLSGSASSIPGLPSSRPSSSQVQPALGRPPPLDAPPGDAETFSRLRPPLRLHLLSQAVPQPPPSPHLASLLRQRPSDSDSNAGPSRDPALPGLSADDGVSLEAPRHLPDPLPSLPAADDDDAAASVIPGPLTPSLEPILEQAPLVLDAATASPPPALQQQLDPPAGVASPPESAHPQPAVTVQILNAPPAAPSTSHRLCAPPPPDAPAAEPAAGSSIDASPPRSGADDAAAREQGGLRPPARLHLLAQAVPQVDRAAAPPVPREQARLQRPARLHLLLRVVPQADEALARKSLGGTSAL